MSAYHSNRKRWMAYNRSMESQHPIHELFDTTPRRKLVFEVNSPEVMIAQNKILKLEEDIVKYNDLIYSVKRDIKMVKEDNGVSNNILSIYRKNRKAGKFINANEFKDVMLTSATGIQKQNHTGLANLSNVNCFPDTVGIYKYRVVPLHVDGVEVGLVIRRTLPTSACAAIVLTWTLESGYEGDAHVHYILSNGGVMSLSNKLSAKEVNSLTIYNVKERLMAGIKFATVANFIEIRGVTVPACKTKCVDYIRLDAFIAASRREEIPRPWNHLPRVVSNFNVLVPNAKQNRDANILLDKLADIANKLSVA